MKYQCPVCQGEMASVEGTVLNPKDGVTLYCPHLSCPAQEVAGHGNNEKDAWTVVQQKFVRREDRK